MRNEARNHVPPYRLIATIAGLSMGLSVLSIGDAQACEPAAAPIEIFFPTEGATVAPTVQIHITYDRWREGLVDGKYELLYAQPEDLATLYDSDGEEVMLEFRRWALVPAEELDDGEYTIELGKYGAQGISQTVNFSVSSEVEAPLPEPPDDLEWFVLNAAEPAYHSDMCLGASIQYLSVQARFSERDDTAQFARYIFSEIPRSKVEDPSHEASLDEATVLGDFYRDLIFTHGDRRLGILSGQIRRSKPIEGCLVLWTADGYGQFLELMAKCEPTDCGTIDDPDDFLRQWDTWSSGRFELGCDYDLPHDEIEPATQPEPDASPTAGEDRSPLAVVVLIALAVLVLWRVWRRLV